MKRWYKIVIPVVIVAVAAGGYLIFSKPEITTQPAKNNQVQDTPGEHQTYGDLGRPRESEKDYSRATYVFRVWFCL